MTTDEILAGLYSLGFGFAENGPKRGMKIVSQAAAEIDRLRDVLEEADGMITELGKNALNAGLEGTTEWDRVAGAADLHGCQSRIQAALKEKK